MHPRMEAASPRAISFALGERHEPGINATDGRRCYAQCIQIRADLQPGKNLPANAEYSPGWFRFKDSQSCVNI